MTQLALACLVLYVACFLVTWGVLLGDHPRRLFETVRALLRGRGDGRRKAPVDGGEELSQLQLLLWVLVSAILAAAWLGVWFISFLCWWRLK